MSLLGDISKILSILLSKFSNCPNTGTSLCYIYYAPIYKTCMYIHLVGVKRKRCGECEGCSRDDCGKCKHCRDMRKFGGPGSLKKPCALKKCKVMKVPTETASKAKADSMPAGTNKFLCSP